MMCHHTKKQPHDFDESKVIITYEYLVVSTNLCSGKHPLRYNSKNKNKNCLKTISSVA